MKTSLSRLAAAATLACCLSLPLPSAIHAADANTTLQKAWTAFNIGKYKETLRLVQPLASDGNARAQVILGRCYESGLGVEQNMETAAQWYLLAAEQNLAEAQQLVAYAYQSGIGLPRDGSKAVYWMQRAADTGSPEACYALSQYYARGQFVERDQKKAFDLALSAAQNGYGQAMLFVGACYAHGVGTTEDAEQARQWNERARAAGLNPDSHVFNEVKEYSMEP